MEPPTTANKGKQGSAVFFAAQGTLGLDTTQLESVQRRLLSTGGTSGLLGQQVALDG